MALAVVLLGLMLAAWRFRLLPGGVRGPYGIGLGVLTALLGLLGLVRVLQFGARKTWLRGHLWLGLLSGWFVLLHSGLRLGGLLELALCLLLGLTLLTGLYGLFLQQVLPRLITARFHGEVPVGQHRHVCGALQREAGDLVDAICGVGTPARGQDGVVPEGHSARAQVRSFYDEEAVGFLTDPYSRSARLAHRVKAGAVFAGLRRGLLAAEDRWLLDRLESLCEQRRLLGEQERLHRRLHRWLRWHIRLSGALLVLAILHAVVSLSIY
jgi:hypothetical protein